MRSDGLFLKLIYIANKKEESKVIDLIMYKFLLLGRSREKEGFSESNH